MSVHTHSDRPGADEPGADGSGTDDGVDPSGPSGPSDASERRPRLQITLIALGAVALLVVGLVAANLNRSGEPWAGTVLSSPQAKPDIVLTDTSGRPFDLRQATKGSFTVLMFGYTSCPDVCPINLGTLEAAMDTLGPQVAGRIDLVFVTVDPATDTPEVLRKYLDKFNTRFVGLTGTPEQVRAAQEAAKVPPAASLTDGSATTADAGGTSGTIGHATQMIVYGPDDQARIVYPFGTRQSDWSRDLPRLLAGEEPTE